MKRVLFVMALFVVVASLYSQDSLNMSFVGSWMIPDTIWTQADKVDMKINGNYLYLTTGKRLHAADISDIDSLEFVGSYTSQFGILGDMWIEDTLIFLASTIGVSVVNDGPTTFSLIDTIQTKYKGDKISVFDTTAILSNMDGCLSFVNASSPNALFTMGGFRKKFRSFYDLYADSAFCFVLADKSPDTNFTRLEAYNYTDPDSVFLTSSYGWRGFYPHDLAVLDSFAYVSCDSLSLSIFSIADPDTIRFVSSFQDGWFYNIGVTNSNLYASTGNTIKVYNLSDQDSIYLEGFYDTGENIFLSSIGIVDSFVFSYGFPYDTIPDTIFFDEPDPQTAKIMVFKFNP